MRAVISLGSNMGTSAELIATAAAQLPGRHVALSNLYATPPWGGVEQDDFLNATAIIDLDEDFSPQQLLRHCQALEADAGRERIIRWGPRTLDVDIITVEGVTSDSEELTLPHPRAHQRLFVLIPWQEIDPTAQLGGRAVADLIAGFNDEEKAEIRVVGPVPHGATGGHQP